MAKIWYDLYLDESGDFDQNDLNRKKEVSFVGGLLIPHEEATNTFLNNLPLQAQEHATEEYRKEAYFSILDSLKQHRGHFVLFQNPERIRVVNPDTTYLNIITEGYIHLAKQLRQMHPLDDITIDLIIANRQAVSFKQENQIKSGEDIKILQAEYFSRIEEKLLIASGRESIQHVAARPCFANAKKDKRLMLADIICNTWLTRKGKRKFTAEDRVRINEWYQDAYSFDVFKSATMKYLDQLLLDGHYGEAMHQLCSLNSLTGFKRIRDFLLDAIVSDSDYLMESWFSQMSLHIRQYNRRNQHEEGIRVAENYKRYILDMIVPPNPYAQKMLNYWRFDTDYFLLTMYDHIGNADKCQAYIALCREEAGAINRSWERIDYYFGYRIRELNVLMGRYAFQNVLDESVALEEIFEQAKELFAMIGTYAEGEKVRSELLGKVYGIQVEAYINLLHAHPEYAKVALQRSDAALSEFESANDLSRQYQWRCLLLNEMDQPREAFVWLMKAAQSESAAQFVEAMFALRPGSYDFLMWHYTNVMLKLQQQKDPLATEMAAALRKHPQYRADTTNSQKKGHPWNLVLWNLARYARGEGDQPTYTGLYRRAREITCEKKDNVTMFAYALSMTADHLLWCRANTPANTAEAGNQFRSVVQNLQRADLPDEMRSYFHLNEIGGDAVVTDRLLNDIASKYLK